MKLYERDCVKKLKEKLDLAKKFQSIHIHKPLSSYKGPMRRHLKKELGGIPILQPEIDMIFQEHSGQLNAAEIKLFRSDDVSYRMSFYEGIGQALALNRFGFDHVALWFLFTPEVPDEKINKFGAEAWSFVRNDMNLQLDFSYFRIKKDNGNLTFWVMQYAGRQTGFSLGWRLDDPEFPITWRHRNPIRCDTIPRTIRESIERFVLKIR